jgi:nicotinate-nucleotide adenylyltransferase
MLPGFLLPVHRGNWQQVNNRLGIMGGTFDPPHAGHIAIAKSFLKSGLIDRLLIIPVFSHPQKDLVLTEFTVRFRMAQAAFENLERAGVSDIEKHLPVPSYTWNTVEYLFSDFPGSVVNLCIGSDSLGGFTTWHRYSDILKKCNLIVAERPGFQRPDLPPEFTGKVSYIPHQPVDVSATRIRQEAAEGIVPDDLIPPAVLEIIRQEGLYCNK